MNERKTVFTDLLARFNRWQMSSLIRLIEEDARLRIEESQRIQRATREWLDDYCMRHPVRPR